MFFMQCSVFYIGGQSCGNQVMHKMQDAAKHDIVGNEIPKVNIMWVWMSKIASKA